MSIKAPSPGGYANDLPPEREVSLHNFRTLNLSLWGRGRRVAAVRGAFLAYCLSPAAFSHRRSKAAAISARV